MSESEFRRLDPATGVATVDRNRVEVVARELDRGQRAIDVATNRRQSLLSRLIPDPLTRKIQEEELAIVSGELEARRRMLKGVREVQLKALESMANAYIGSINSENRAGLILLIARKRVEIQKEIELLYGDFLDRLETGYKRAATIRRKSLRELEEERLDNAAFEVKDLVETILRQFAAAVSQQITV